jgi:hypothetical protein
VLEATEVLLTEGALVALEAAQAPQEGRHPLDERPLERVGGAEDLVEGVEQGLELVPAFPGEAVSENAFAREQRRRRA